MLGKRASPMARLPARDSGRTGLRAGRARAGLFLAGPRQGHRALAAALAALALTAGIPDPSAFAEPRLGDQPVLSIGVAPSITALDLHPGEAKRLTVTFTSGGNRGCDVQARPQDALRRQQGLEFAEPGEEFWSAGNWLTVEPPAFTMRSNERRELAVTLAVPEGTPEGEYYAALSIGASPSDQPGLPSGASLQFKGNVVSLFCIAIGGHGERSARLVPYGEVPFGPVPGDEFPIRALGALKHWWLSCVIRTRNVAILAEGQPLKVFAPLENTSKVHVQPRVTVTFRKQSTVLRQVTTSGDIILPAEKKTIEAVWPDAPPYGLYDLDLEVEYGGPEPIEVSRSFLILPVKGILGLVVLSFGLGYFLAGRKRGKTSPIPPSSRLPA